MCGISGIFSFEKFNNKQDIKKIVKSLLIDIESRGRDATGLSLINSEDDEISVYKKDICATQFINTKQFHKVFKSIENYNIILLHTRLATHGDENKNVNNHPHLNKTNNNVLIHNGVISNYESLKDRFNLKLDSKCDSEAILSLFNRKKQDIKTTLKFLRGNMAIALYNKEKLYLYSNGNPLNVCYNKTRNLFLFSSFQEVFSEIFCSAIREEHDLFNFPEDADEISVYNCDDEDLIKVYFKNKKIKKDSADIDDDYTYFNNYNPQKLQTEKQDTLKEERKKLKNLTDNLAEKRAILSEEKANLTDAEEEILKDIEINRADDLNESEHYKYDYMTTQEYFNAIDEEDAERERRHKNKIHTQPLSYNAYGYSY